MKLLNWPINTEIALSIGATFILAVTYYFIIPVPLGNNLIAYSFDFPISLAMLLMCGPLTTGLARGFTCWLSAVQLRRARWTNIFIQHVAFNAAANIIATFIAGLVYYYLGGNFLYLYQSNNTNLWLPIVIPGTLAGLSMVICQGIIINTSVIIRENRSWYEGWVENIGWTLIPNLLLIPSGLLLAFLGSQQQTKFLLYVLIPYATLLISLRSYIKIKNDSMRFFLETLAILTINLHNHNTYNVDHLRYVSLWSERIGRQMRLSEDQLFFLRYAGIFHNIGKLSWNENLLSKTGKLTSEEIKTIINLPVESASIIQSIEYLQYIIPWIQHHHERWDGKGYPNGLKGDEIPYQATIIGLADAFHAMQSQERKYTNNISKYQAIQEIKQLSGTQFNPEAITALLQLIDIKDNIIDIIDNSYLPSPYQIEPGRTLGSLMLDSHYSPTQRGVSGWKIKHFVTLMWEERWDWNMMDDFIRIDQHGNIKEGHHRIIAAKICRINIPGNAIIQGLLYTERPINWDEVWVLNVWL